MTIQLQVWSLNPAIEALNPSLSRADITAKLLCKPKFEKPSPQKAIHERVDDLMAMEDAYTPFSHVVRLAQCIQSTIRFGYACRNPMASGFWNEDTQEWNQGLQGRKHQTITGINLAGPPGLGKSLIALKACQLQPQVIRHSVYVPPAYSKAVKISGLENLQLRQNFPHVQLTYLKVECAANRTPKAMAKSIFAAADEALGYTNYLERYGGNGSISDYLIRAERLARNHSLGLLVVDEVHRLQNSPETMEFLVSLNNAIKVPVMFIGLEDMIEYFQTNGSIARRGNKMGDHKWDVIPWNTESGKKQWMSLMKTLWPYQVVAESVDLTEELAEEFWKGAGGTPDYGVKLFHLANVRAMESKIEKLTPQVIRACSDSLEFSQLIIHDPKEYQRRKHHFTINGRKKK